MGNDLCLLIWLFRQATQIAKTEAEVVSSRDRFPQSEIFNLKFSFCCLPSQKGNQTPYVVLGCLYGGHARGAVAKLTIKASSHFCKTPIFGGCHLFVLSKDRPRRRMKRSVNLSRRYARARQDPTHVVWMVNKVGRKISRNLLFLCLSRAISRKQLETMQDSAGKKNGQVTWVEIGADSVVPYVKSFSWLRMTRRDRSIGSGFSADMWRGHSRTGVGLP